MSVHSFNIFFNVMITSTGKVILSNIHPGHITNQMETKERVLRCVSFENLHNQIWEWDGTIYICHAITNLKSAIR